MNPIFAKTPSFSLENFEGPLELLLYLIQKEEIDVCAVTMGALTKQLITSLEESEVEISAELMGLAATLLLLKSQKLLPFEELSGEESECDPRIEMIEKLIEYCRFRDAATSLLNREEEQRAFFPRAALPFQRELGPGLDEIDLSDLKTALLDVIKRAEKKRRLIPDEEWHVAPKIDWLQNLLTEHRKILFTEIFTETKCKGELIVSFLALLELLKLQKLQVAKENNLLYIILPNEHKSS